MQSMLDALDIVVANAALKSVATIFPGTANAKISRAHTSTPQCHGYCSNPIYPPAPRLLICVSMFNQLRCKATSGAPQTPK